MFHLIFCDSVGSRRIHTIFTVVALAILIAILTAGCGEPSGTDSATPLHPKEIQGTWTAELKSPGGPLRFEIVIPANSVKAGLAGTMIRNGGEEIEVSWDAASLFKDTMTIGFPHYNSKIQCSKKGPEELAGKWTKVVASDQTDSMKFSARRGKRKYVSKGFEKFAGRYQIQFESSDDPAVGIFQSKNGRVEGTFMTTTGDYRFLAGDFDSSNREMTLSCFDGGHAFLFKVLFEGDGKLSGDFWSRGNWHEKFTGQKDDAAAIAGGFTQVEWVEQDLGTIKFPNLAGTPKALDAAEFAGKIKLIQVFGSWCPNCHDASKFLNELHQEYADRGLSIVGLAFELTGDFEKDSLQLKRYKKRTGCSYPLLIAGLSDKQKATEKLKILSEVKSYPTTLFLDRNDRPLAIHSGFSGPATGHAYQDLKAKFRKIIETELAK